VFPLVATLSWSHMLQPGENLQVSGARPCRRSTVRV
jgi:hypothetical protein